MTVTIADVERVLGTAAAIEAGGIIDKQFALATDTKQIIARDGANYRRMAGIDAANIFTENQTLKKTAPTILLEDDDTSLGTDQLIGSYEFKKADTSGAGAGVIGGLRMHSEDSSGISSYIAFSLASTHAAANDFERWRMTSLGELENYQSPASIASIKFTDDGGVTFPVRITANPGSESLTIKTGSNKINGVFDERTKDTLDQGLSLGTGETGFGAANYNNTIDILELKSRDADREAGLRLTDFSSTLAHCTQIRFVKRAGGTTVINGAHTLGELKWIGYYDTDIDLGEAGMIRVTANPYTAAWNSGASARNARMEFDTLNAGSLTNAMIIDNLQNVGIGAVSFGTSASKVLGILTGTKPGSGVANQIQMYSLDLSAGNTMLGIYTEGTPIGSGTPTQDKTMAIEINGVTYYVLLSTTAS